MASKYKEILDNIEWSFSTLHLYEQCPYALYNKKICKSDGTENAYAQIGKFAHEINEKIYKKEATVDHALNEWIDEYDNHIFNYISESSKEKKFLAFCDYLAAFDEKFFDCHKILEVETKFKWRVGKYDCVGLVDLSVEENETNKILLIDHKSASPFFGKKGQLLKAQIDNFNSYKKQMYMYCKPIYEKYGRFPDKIIWNHLFDSTQSIIDFNIEDYNATQDWVIRTIKKIYNDKDFDAFQSYMMCYQLCNYRYDCEYKDELRE